MWIVRRPWVTTCRRFGGGGGDRYLSRYKTGATEGSHYAGEKYPILLCGHAFGAISPKGKRLTGGYLPSGWFVLRNIILWGSSKYFCFDFFVGFADSKLRKTGWIGRTHTE